MNTNQTEEVLIDDFMPMPGAESIATKDNISILSTEPEFDTQDLLELNKGEESNEEKLKTDKEEIKETNELLEEVTGLNKTYEEEDDDSPNAQNKGRKKIDKSGVLQVVKELIDDKLILPFEDDKSLEDYTVADFKELIKANFEDKINAVREQTPKEFFEALPEEMQYAARYIAEGGKDLKSLFKALSQVEETKSLNIENDDHQEMIARYYLQATNYGKGDEGLIEEQIEEWKTAGTLKNKAAKFKPLLDEMEKEVVEAQIKQQEDWKKTQQNIKEAYLNNIYKTLEPGEINGLKLDKKKQEFLWNELTTIRHKSRNGNPTNLLGKLLEDYQFSNEPRYDLIVETLWLLSDPDDYKKNIREGAKKEVVADTVRKLKTEEGRRNSGVTVEEQGNNERRLKKPANIFKR